jgi:hypothetical protein
MKCMKCGGKLFVDRTFSDNRNLEVYCIMCGVRKFISKNGRFGAWLMKQESGRVRL